MLAIVLQKEAKTRRLPFCEKKRSAKRKSVKSLDKDWAAQVRRFAPSRFDKYYSVMLSVKRLTSNLFFIVRL